MPTWRPVRLWRFNSASTDMMRKKGITLIEIMVAGAYIAIVVSAAVYGGKRYGALGIILGLVVGAVAPIAFFKTLFFLEARLWVGVPAIPVCSDGKCRSRDYKLQPDGTHVNFICRCGHRFRKRGRRFVRVVSDGSEEPYLVWRPFRAWFPDRAPQQRAG